jgi:protein-S-isoprenylcysteine O-methyltransferase Ste14
MTSSDRKKPDRYPAARPAWRNVPLPEPYLAALAAGGLLHLTAPRRIFRKPWMGHLVGSSLFLAGVGLAAWAVAAADNTDIATPDRLVTRGPYAVTRNPMYLGWAAITLGIAAATNARWILRLFPFAALCLHVVDVRREEIDLERAFGDRYLAYRRRVPRYL